MATRNKFVKIYVASEVGDAPTLTGYRVIGDWAGVKGDDAGKRYLVMERPEQAATTRKPRAKKDRGLGATVTPLAGVANG
ncbi:MAG: hypothetical protein WA804_01680 [Terriglobales bacterium]|jgi:hypothetical protein